MLTMQSPLGPLTLAARHNRLVSILFGEGAGSESLDPVLHEARRQLEEYFAGSRRDFDLPLGASGTPFQQEVWGALVRIPFGHTASYAEVARLISRPRAVRAVGAANARNPLAIVVPCHRVIGSDGQLTGYAGGLAIKRWLLDHEGQPARREPLRGEARNSRDRKTPGAPARRVLNQPKEGYGALELTEKLQIRLTPLTVNEQL